MVLEQPIEPSALRQYTHVFLDPARFTPHDYRLLTTCLAERREQGYAALGLVLRIDPLGLARFDGHAGKPVPEIGWSGYVVDEGRGLVFAAVV